MALTDHARKTITDLLDNNRVVLFMKGSPSMPQCGFSAKATGILGSLLGDYATFNVLEDEEVREGIKEFGQWPTIPQLYVDRELIGGSDIINEMFGSGELHDVLGLEQPDRTPPTFTISEAAANAIRQSVPDQGSEVLHFAINDHWQGEFMLQPATGHEIRAEASGIELHMDPMTAQKARDMHIDWIETMQGSGLSVDLPMAPPAVKPMTVAELATRLDSGVSLRVYDVRSEPMRTQKPFDAATPLDRDAMADIDSLPKDTPMAFLCQRGNSSAATAEHFRLKGYTQVFNIVGGLDAWEQQA